MLDLSPSKWKLQVSEYRPVIDKLTWNKYPPRFSSRIIKISTSARKSRKKVVKKTWRRAGYLQQVQRGAETHNLVVPLNQQTIFVLPKLQTSYQLAFRPVGYWLPNLKLSIWEYTEREPDGLGVMGVEAEPLQIQNQIVQAIEVLLDAGENPND